MQRLIQRFQNLFGRETTTRANTRIASSVKTTLSELEVPNAVTIEAVVIWLEDGTQITVSPSVTPHMPPLISVRKLYT